MENIMRERILAVIEKNSRIDLKDLAVLLGESELWQMRLRIWRRSILSADIIR